MPMGCASSCKTFETFSTAIEWIAQNKLGIANLIYLLDDFPLIQPTGDQCSLSRLFLDLCDFLGLPIAPEKTFGPSTILTFAGVELDTIRCESRLPEDNLLKFQQLIDNFLRRKKATLNFLQELFFVYRAKLLTKKNSGKRFQKFGYGTSSMSGMLGVVTSRGFPDIPERTHPSSSQPANIPARWGVG